MANISVVTNCYTLGLIRCSAVLKNWGRRLSMVPVCLGHKLSPFLGTLWPKQGSGLTEGVAPPFWHYCTVYMRTQAVDMKPPPSLPADFSAQLRATGAMFFTGLWSYQVYLGLCLCSGYERKLSNDYRSSSFLPSSKGCVPLLSPRPHRQ